MLVVPWNTWAGYATVASTSNPVTSFNVGGQWTVPSVSCAPQENSRSAVWVGLGGLMPGGTTTGQYIAQVGIMSRCEYGTPAYYAVYQMYNAALPLGATFLF